jgi:hypothetical protein
VIDAVVYFSLAAAAAVLLLGVTDLIISWRVALAAKNTLAVTAARLGPERTKDDSQNSILGPADLKGALDALAAFANALKDLDRSARLLLLSLAFVTIAAASAGVGAIADAV